MNKIILYSGIVMNCDNQSDVDMMLSKGARELTSQEIAAAGMNGYEHLVSPENTTVNDDGSIVFTPPESLPDLELRAQIAAAQAQSRTILMARMQADMVQTGAFAAAEFATFARAGLFTDWAAGQTYVKGYRLAHKGIVYEVMQEVTAIENQPPDAAGLLAVYRPLSVDPETGEEPDGSREHPFAFLYGMDVTKDSYYSYEGKLWLARADMPACVWTPGTEGLWQWEEASAAETAVYTPGVV